LGEVNLLFQLDKEKNISVFFTTFFGSLRKNLLVVLLTIVNV